MNLGSQMFTEAQSEQHNDDWDVLSSAGVSETKLQIIKAKTMYEMVEEIDDGKVKVLFMTNPQAEMIAKEDDSMQKMLDALDVPKPSLVIDLLHSWGFYESTCLMKADVFKDGYSKWCAGVQHEQSPFLDDAEERDAEDRLDMFMSQVLIPLAEQTNAVVFCNAVCTDCILSSSFTKMVAVMSSKWKGRPPFSVISSLGSIHVLYKNTKEDAYWHQIRKQCPAWQQRHPELQRVFSGSSDSDWRGHDLNAYASCILVTDNLKPPGKNNASSKRDRGPFASLMTSLVRYLGTKVPALAVKTGASVRIERLQGSVDPMSISMMVDRANSGTPVLCIDVRNRRMIRDLELLTTEGSKANEADDAAGDDLRELPAVPDARTARFDPDSPMLNTTSSHKRTRIGEIISHQHTQKGEAWREIVIGALYRESEWRSPTPFNHTIRS